MDLNADEWFLPMDSDIWGTIGFSPGASWRSGVVIPFFKKIDFYIFWPQWVFAVARGLALVAVHRLLTEWPLLLWSTGCRQVGFRSCSSQALECRFSSCGARAQLPCGM